MAKTNSLLACESIYTLAENQGTRIEQNTNTDVLTRKNVVVAFFLVSVINFKAGSTMQTFSISFHSPMYTVYIYI